MCSKPSLTKHRHADVVEGHTRTMRLPQRRHHWSQTNPDPHGGGDHTRTMPTHARKTHTHKKHTRTKNTHARCPYTEIRENEFITHLFWTKSNNWTGRYFAKQHPMEHRIQPAESKKDEDKEKRTWVRPLYKHLTKKEVTMWECTPRHKSVTHGRRTLKKPSYERLSSVGKSLSKFPIRCSSK